ncbi:hypothetical protein G3A_07065 [Bacillus sp. 17376]|uniref:Phage protein n=1 Tax=Mesobacillus boroniphilus JCM 21738 TaxID=1294265 RepID=W4RPZ4_9BACI|nr:hypothetical protein [Mesobacillus boroniphilus]ESU33254.1 hypothetical protein G3A_07065 [Bacillus sp. 17376]GAE46197.1 phage protein [Mesobacillus boroniphilus JCM 21738]
MLTKRDKEVLKDLQRFRCMDRDSIAELHFGGLKHPVHSANNVMLRLMRDGEVTRSNIYTPFVYFPAETQIKKNGQKVHHFLAILDVYKELRRLGDLGTFLVEPKYGKKGVAEPDIYCQYRRTGFFVEVQRTIYSEKQMRDKLDRYVDLYNSGIMAAPFPHVLILADHRYAIEGNYPFRIFQANSFTEFVQSLKPQPQPVNQVVSSTVKIKIG